MKGDVLPVTALEHYPLLALLYAGVVFGFAAFVSHFARPRTEGSVSGKGRFGTLDGLRGLLAMGVLVHHSFAAYVYFTTGRWAWSESAVLNQMGQSTVAVFFMITGFLFSIKAAEPKISWHSFYVNRLARLAPLYIVFVGVVVLLVFGQSSWQLLVSPLELLAQVLRWLAFVCFGRPDINGYRDTWILVAGVNWSLAYEVYFYVVCFPLLYFGYRFLGWVNMSTLIFLAALVLLGARAVGWLNGGYSLYASQFLLGAVVAHLKDSSIWQRRFSSEGLAAAALAALSILGCTLDSHGVLAVLCAGILLLASARGLSAFGLLELPAVVWLGEISYGVYLLHGIVLVGILGFISGVIDLNTIGLAGFSLLVCAIAGGVVLLASLSYRFLERPAMRKARLRFN